MRTKEYQKLAFQYRAATDWDERRKIVAKALETDGAAGVDTLAWILGVFPAAYLAAAFGLAERYHRSVRRHAAQRVRPGRRRRGRTKWPPGYRGDACRLAEAAGGGRGWSDEPPPKRRWEPLVPSR